MRLLAASLTVMVCLMAANPSGRFTGTWTSGASGSGGAIQMTFAGSGAEWSAQSSFTYQGEEVRTDTVSTKISDDQIEVVFAYDLDGNKLRSTMKGTLAGDRITGKYVSRDAGGQPVDEGTWEATRK